MPWRSLSLSLIQPEDTSGAAIVSLDPNEANAGRNNDLDVDVTTELMPSDAVGVINGVQYPGAVDWQSPTLSILTVPVALFGEPGTLSIRFFSGGRNTNQRPLSVLGAAPVVDTVTPAFQLVAQPADAGFADFLLEGSGFYAAPVGYTTARVNGAPATGGEYEFTVDSDTEITLGVSNQRAQSFDVDVINTAPGGGTSATFTRAVRYPVPTIQSVSPSFGTVGAGDTVVTFANLDASYYDIDPNTSGPATTATLTPSGGGTPVSLAVTFNNQNELEAVIPAAYVVPGGSYDLTLSNPTTAGGGGDSAPFAWAVDSPTTTGLSFHSRVRGFDAFSLRVDCTNVIPGDVVYFAGTALATTYVDGTTLRGLVTGPLLAVAGLVSVTVRRGAFETNAQAFEVLAWDYDEIGSSLRGYFPATTAVNDGTGRASQWTDYYASGRNPTQANAGERPAIVAGVAAMNGATCLFFDGTRGDFLEYSDWVVAGAVGFITKTAYKIFVAGSANTALQVGSDPTILGEPGAFINVANLQLNVIRATDNSVSVDQAFAWGGGAAFVVTHRKSGGFLYERVNQLAESAGAAVGAVYSPATFLIGRGRTGTWKYTGYVGALLVCDADINHTNTWQVINLFSYEFGTAFRTVSGTITPTACSPSSADQYDTPFEITVTCAGGGLVAGCVVNMEGEVLASTVDSGTSIRAMLTATSLATFATKGITIGNASGIGEPLAFVVNEYIPGAGPNLTSLGTTAATRGDDGFDEIGNGTNFTLTSVMLCDGVPLLTVFLGPTQLSGRITEEILNTSGAKSITVTDTLGTSGAQILNVAAWDFDDIPEISDWLEGDTVVTSGSNITQATDKTGNSRHAVQATGTKQPLHVASSATMNNQATMQFDGVNDDLVVAGVSVNPNIFTISALCCVVVFRATAITGTSGTSSPFSNNNVVALTASSFFGMSVRTGPLMYAYTNDGSIDTVSATIGAAGTTQLAIFRKFGGTSYLGINDGTEVTLASGNTTFSSQNLSLGSALGANYFNGQIGVVATFTNTPSAANLRRIINTTRIKYGWI